jgi:hypothetical protein
MLRSTASSLPHILHQGKSVVWNRVVKETEVLGIRPRLRIAGRGASLRTSWSEIGRVLGASDQAESKTAVIDEIVDNRRAALEHLLRVTT